MDHFKFHFKKVDQQQQELLIALLSGYADGFEQFDEELLAFTADEKAFGVELKTLDRLEYTVEKVAVKNWNEIWESDFQPVTIFGENAPFLHIRASFHKPLCEAKYETIITPKMSFGTGHHPTTALVVELMANIRFEEKDVIDFGTGTGLLAILAEKMGAKNILAIDHDEWSIANARENLSVNACERTEVIKADKINCDFPVDIILANINLNIILAQLEDIFRCAKKEGIILLSGMLVEDTQQISEALLNRGIMIDKVVSKNKWIAVQAHK